MFTPSRPTLLRSGLLALLVLLLLLTPGPANPRVRQTAHPGFHPAPQPRFHPVHAPVQRMPQRVNVNHVSAQRVTAMQTRQRQGYNAMPYRLAPVTHHQTPTRAAPVVLRPGTVNPFRPVSGPTNVVNIRNSTRQNVWNGNINSSRPVVRNGNLSGLRMVPTPLTVAKSSTTRRTTAVHATRGANSNFGQLGRLHSLPNQVFSPRSFNFTNNGIILNENVKKIQKVVQINRGPRVSQVNNLQKVVANLRSHNRPVKMVNRPVKVVNRPVKVVNRPAATRPLVSLQQQVVKLWPGGSSSSSSSSGLPFSSFLGGPAAAVEEMVDPNEASLPDVGDLPGVGSLPGFGELPGVGNLADVGNLPGLGNLPLPQNFGENFAAPEAFGVAPLGGFNPLNAMVLGLGTVVSSFAAEDQAPVSVLLQELVGVQQAAQESVDDLLASQIGELLAPPPAPEEE